MPTGSRIPADDWFAAPVNDIARSTTPVSMVSMAAAAWPPSLRTSFSSRSWPAKNGPGRNAGTEPAGMTGPVVHANRLLGCPQRSINAIFRTSRARPPPPSSAGLKITNDAPRQVPRFSARYCAAPKSSPVWPSWPQACIALGRLGGIVPIPGLPRVDRQRVNLPRPMTFARAVSALITPTTPVRPMLRRLVASQRPASFSATVARGAVWSQTRFRGVQCRSRRSGDVGVQFGKIGSKRAIFSKSSKSGRYKACGRAPFQGHAAG